MRYHPDGTLPTEGEIFVFGSNFQGIHGKGAAKIAHERFGAEWGTWEGLAGRSYAIPTRTKTPAGMLTLPLSMIEPAIERFLSFAQGRPKHSFFVTRIGCGLAGYKDEQIAPLFRFAPRNCSLPNTWREWTDVAGDEAYLLDGGFPQP